MIRVVIISDIRFYREGLKEILERDSLVSVIGMACDVEHGIIEIKQSNPDVVLIDMTMMTSREAVGYIMSSCCNAKIVALAVTEDENTILACAKAGIAGYVSREASIEQLVNTICAVSQGELYCPRRIAASLIHQLKLFHDYADISADKALQQQKESKMVLLTRREKQIAKQLINGLSNKQIARNLSIEISTVKNHVHNILVKMGVESRMQAANILLHHQII